jgi:hypothetical protein
VNKRVGKVGRVIIRSYRNTVAKRDEEVWV